MAGNLTTNTSSSSSGNAKLTVVNAKFKVCIQEPLHQKYCFKKLKKESLHAFEQFIGETVGKNLTISDVDNLFLRKKGPVKNKEIIQGIEREVVHYGKDRNPFRLHGYYNEDGYFVLHKIDPKHNVHK